MRALHSTDWTALSAATLKPFLFKSEDRGVTNVSSAHASQTTAMSASSRASVGDFPMDLCFQIFKEDSNRLFVHCVDGFENCDHGRRFLSLQEAVVALIDGCA